MYLIVYNKLMEYCKTHKMQSKNEINRTGKRTQKMKWFCREL